MDDTDKNRGSLERIKVHVTFAVFTFDPPSSKVSQIDQLNLFMSALPSVATSKGIEDGWDILPDFEENVIDDERVFHYGLIASGCRWETDKEYKERLETNLFYKKQAYDHWLSKTVHFSSGGASPSPHIIQVCALEKKIAEIGK